MHAVTRDAPSYFFVTNFTSVTDTWSLTVPVYKSGVWNNSTKVFPCNPSVIMPDNLGACDFQVRLQSEINE